MPSRTQPGRTLMVQGTASDVGKSLMVAALCRHFRNAGVKTAPFKAQNLSLNSAVTPDGYEIGRAQAVQAEASGIPPRVEMNPILLKPESEQRAQLVVMGKRSGSTEANAYHDRRAEMRDVIAQSLRTLRDEHDLVIIEGAGSPAEVNLKHRDLVNMHVARLAEAPVLLVGDIDRGGVFASIVGTLELLDPEDRVRVAGFIVNKFRGDVSLLQSGLDFLEERTGRPVLGVVPHVPNLHIADEDAVALEGRPHRLPVSTATPLLDVAVIRLPHLSNYDDLLPLEKDPRVRVRYVESAGEVGMSDLVVLPGSKSTVSDLRWVREKGFGVLLESRARRKQHVLGICGGCQMLGEWIEDPHCTESSQRSAPGLGLLPLRTCFSQTKTTAQVRMLGLKTSFLTKGTSKEDELAGYEIHMGQVETTADGVAPFLVTTRNGTSANHLDGACSPSGTVVGTMIHGVLENPSVRECLLTTLSGTSSAGRPDAPELPSSSAELDRLERTVSQALDMNALWQIAKLR